LYTELGEGIKVEYYTARDDYREADFVIDTIASLKRFYGYRNSDFAILVRMNSLSRLFESRLSDARLRYRVMGGFRFFDRKEIQDVIAYMRAANNLRDGEAIERIINFPRRGIGDTTVEKLDSFSRRTMTDLIDVISGLDKNQAVTGAAAKKVEEFKELIFDLFNNKNMPLGKYVEYLVKRAGFEAAYLESGAEDDKNRLENIEEFVRHVKEYEAANPEKGLSEFLETVALAPERRENVDGEAVTLATMHSVKGLEFAVVFITGCEEDIFPSAQSKKEGKVEEERRVMYVAATRAKERLYITNTLQRFRFNRIENYPPSRFIAESKGLSRGGESIFDRRGGGGERRERGRYNVFDSGEREIITPPKPSGAASIPRSEPVKILNKDVSGFIGGARVSHPVYGEGKIILVLGQGDEASATVLFPQLGIKKFKIALAPLTLIKG